MPGMDINLPQVNVGTTAGQFTGPAGTSFAGGGGFNPLHLLAGLAGGPWGAIGTALLPSLLSKLGLFGGDPQAKLRKQVAMLSSPQNLQRQTQFQYNQALQSPAFARSQGAIAGAGNTAINQLASSLGSRGLSGTGIGSVAGSLASSIPGIQMGNLYSNTFGQAQNAAQNQIQQQINSLLQAGAGPSQTQQLFAGGLQSLAPYFLR